MTDLKDIATAYTKLELPVLWGNMDAANHVNNTVYLRWMESVRIEMFLKMGSGNFNSNTTIPILAYQDCKYIFPVTFPDTVLLTYDVISIKTDRILCLGKIYSKKHNRLAALSHNTFMPFDTKTSKKTFIPEDWKQEWVDFYGDSIIDK